jgi:hypothetical protein
MPALRCDMTNRVFPSSDKIELNSDALSAPRQVVAFVGAYL